LCRFFLKNKFREKDNLKKKNWFIAGFLGAWLGPLSGIYFGVGAMFLIAAAFFGSAIICYRYAKAALSDEYMILSRIFFLTYSIYMVKIYNNFILEINSKKTELTAFEYENQCKEFKQKFITTQSAFIFIFLLNLFVISGSIVRSVANFQDGKIMAGILKILLIPIAIGLTHWWCGMIMTVTVFVGNLIFETLPKIFRKKPKDAVYKPSNCGLAEVQSCLVELETIEKDANSAFFQSAAFNTIKPYVVRLIKDKEKTVCSIKEDKMTPHNLVLLLITNVTGELLSSGRYHIYRGILNMTGTGLLAIWHYAISELEKSGYYSSEQAKEDNEWINKQIKEVG
jgi:hypothetical protein